MAERCRGCPHPPHLGLCTRRNGGTGYACGCSKQTPRRGQVVSDDMPACECGHVCDEHEPSGRECTVPGCPCLVFDRAAPLASEGREP